jgi:hypothetical protein
LIPGLLKSLKIPPLLAGKLPEVIYSKESILENKYLRKFDANSIFSEFVESSFFSFFDDRLASIIEIILIAAFY